MIMANTKVKYKRAECIIPQLDSTYNVSDSSDAGSPDYLDLENTNIIQYRTRGQKQRQKAAEAEFGNRRLANIESIRPNTRARNKGKRYQTMKRLIWTNSQR